MTGAPAAPFFNITLLGLAVAAMWGISDFLGGIATRRARSLVVVTIAHGLSLAVLVAIAVFSHAHIPSERTAMWGLITGVSGGLAVIVFYHALAVGEMGLTAALTGVLTAVIPVVFSFFTEGRPRTTQLVGFVTAMLAIFLIAYEPRGHVRSRGLGLAVLAGLGFGAFLITSKYASQGALLWPLADSRFASASLAAAMLLMTRVRRGSAGSEQVALGENGPAPAKNQALSHGMLVVFGLAGAAGLLEAAANLLYMFATLAGRLDVIAVLSSLYPAGTILLAVWLLKERVTRTKAAGMILALLAVGLISL